MHNGQSELGPMYVSKNMIWIAQDAAINWIHYEKIEKDFFSIFITSNV